ncbi:MFS transporter [Melissococcus plutonius]|uniref:Oligogalacturonide transporter n=1 Tax=Melissococcus plutonius TaxID=33970 RepID=A0A2Z5Y1N0_9ENTE|nr:MFS transporter [Melissococcus plutonius]BAL61827.1 oligogalacturonide transporter [Melissococcus plutonius DAT561]MCV2499356.1 MFS transporter [Melissococcus plutonius]MCV2501592.1 MFS transporter [Melissococcus plutonius]MCV2505691.1 MFS transporter [Melissococcus plutonius]MCV2507880.1 MFS transporter [Melissococcus plutonius]
MNKKGNWVYLPKKVTVSRGICYGLTDLMGGGWNNIVSGVIFAFVMSQGISPAFAGAITGIGRIVDAVFSLFFGAITDGFYRTKLGRRFGRRHFFILLGGILFAILFPLFWLKSDDWHYYLLIYVAIEVVIAMILIPWETLPTEMTDDYNLRTVLSGSRMFISATGTAIVFLVLAALKHMQNPNAYLITGIIWTIIFVVAIFVSYRTTWERPLTPAFITELEDHPRLSFSQFLKQTTKDYFSTFKNKVFRQHLAIYLLSFTGKDFYSTLLPTFIVCCMQGIKDDVPWTLQALSIFGIFATIIAAKLMITHGPRFLFSISYITIILTMIGYLLTWALPIKNVFWLLIILSIFYQCARAILEFIPWNIFPFIPDVDHVMTRGDRAGIYAAVMTFFRKSTGALASWIAGILLAEIGFDSKTMTNFLNTPHDIQAKIALIFFTGPVLLICLAFILSLTFKLNRQTHEILKEEINRLETGGLKSDVTPEAKKVVEELTGHSYQDAWPEHP